VSTSSQAGSFRLTSISLPLLCAHWLALAQSEDMRQEPNAGPLDARQTASAATSEKRLNPLP
jgi:hypothetical protein